MNSFANAPSLSSSLEFELPRGRRAARASHREAMFRARQRSELLREAIQQTQLEVQTAMVELDQFTKQLKSKRDVLAAAIVEENILTTQWRIIGGDDSRVGIKLENLLDAQQRRTDAEKDLVAVETDYMIGLVQLQRAMGTLLLCEGFRPYRSPCVGDVQFLRD
ncbi:MAG: TolC family protein [Planctomycetota bacterium]